MLPIGPIDLEWCDCRECTVPISANHDLAAQGVLYFPLASLFVRYNNAA